jgi:uncharacterized protein (DUF1330 family)
MPAYVIFDIHVDDPDAYAPYRGPAGEAVAAHGGRYLARGGAAEVLEGEWELDRLVVLEFPSMEQAKAWYHSPEYQEVAPIRHAASRGRAVIVEGYAG